MPAGKPRRPPGHGQYIDVAGRMKTHKKGITREMKDRKRKAAEYHKNAPSRRAARALERSTMGFEEFKTRGEFFPFYIFGLKHEPKKKKAMVEKLKRRGFDLEAFLKQDKMARAEQELSDYWKMHAYLSGVPFPLTKQFIYDAYLRIKRVTKGRAINSELGIRPNTR